MGMDRTGEQLCCTECLRDQERTVSRVLQANKLRVCPGSRWIGWDQNIEKWLLRELAVRVSLRRREFILSKYP